MPSELFFEIFAARQAGEIAAALQRLDPGGWRSLVETARQHKCVPLLRERLQSWKLLEHAPEAVQHELTCTARSNALRNLRRYAQLSELMDELNGAAPLILLKGGRLARTHYAELSLRTMVDLDVLAQPGHFSLVEKKLEACGFRRSELHDQDGESRHEIAFHKNAVTIELHRTLLDEGHPFAIDDEGLWERAIPAGGSDLLYLSIEDQLLHVCLHAAYHHMLVIGLYAFVDMGRLCMDSSLEWQVFVERVRRWRANRCVYLSLKLAECLVRAPVPPEVMRDLRPPGFDDALLAGALHTVRRAMDQKKSAEWRFAYTLAWYSASSDWRRLPTTLRHRFLAPPEQRTRWSPEQGSDWLSQVRPLLAGAARLTYDPRQWQLVVDHVRGRRLRRWMEQRS